MRSSICVTRAITRYCRTLTKSWYKGSVQSVRLPISKSFANRLLILQAMHGDPLLEVSCATPDDVRILRNALAHIEQTAREQVPLTLDLGNAGTAVRFLTAYAAFLQGRRIVLTGSERMRQRPIAPLVTALRKAGAQITYTEHSEAIPISIDGVPLPKNIQPIEADGTLSTQFVSALLLAGVPVKTATESP